MTRSLEVYDNMPAKSGAFSPRNWLQFRFQLLDDHEQAFIPPDVNMGTIQLSLKAEGAEYHKLIEDGEPVEQYSEQLFLWQEPIGCGERGCSQTAMYDCMNRFLVGWHLWMTFPDDETFWLKLECEDEFGEYYSEEWSFTTGVSARVDRARLVYTGPVNLGLVAADVKTTSTGDLVWSPADPQAPIMFELMVWPRHLPKSCLVTLLIDDKPVTLVEDQPITLSMLGPLYDGIPAGGSLSFAFSMRGNTTLSKMDYASFSLYAITYGLCGTDIGCGVGGCGYNGQFEIDRLDIDFIGYIVSYETQTYWSSLGLSIRQ